MKLKLKISPDKKARPGMCRKCEDANCTVYIPTPYVRCQEHRTDYAVKETVVPEVIGYE